MAPEPVECKNVSLVGYHDLRGRPGFKMGVQEVDSRWYLYTAHFWHSGWSIVDVTDPTDPEQVAFVEGPTNTSTSQLDVADGLMVTGLERPNAGWQPVDGPSYDPDGEHAEGAYIWDVSTDPTDPELLGQYETGGRGTHRNFYAGGDYVYMCANRDDFDGQMLEIVDLSEPSNPQVVSQWWWPGQRVDESADPRESFTFDVPGAGGGARSGFFHGPAYVDGDRAYLSCGRIGVVILDIATVTDPSLLGQIDFGGLGSYLGVHSAVPIPGTDLLAVNSEAILEGAADSLNYTFLVDVSDPALPVVESAMPLPTPEEHLPYGNYYAKGGRFGPHNQHHYQHQPSRLERDDVLFMTYFNAGLRVFDISDPLVPSEVGYYVPEDPEMRIGSKPETLVTQFEDVLVDARGYIYCTAKNYGLFVLEYEGLDETP